MLRLPFRANKALSGEQVSYTGFSGGLNLAASPEALQPDELAVADNVKQTVASLLLLTLTGADKFVPLFRLPREPEVKLKEF